MLTTFNPLVSIIVTTFQRPFYLCKTLQTILSQSYRNLEVIVVDDGSNDAGATLKTVKSFSDERVHFYSIKASKRPAVPRNFGLRHARGELIAFCDDDDLWCPQKLSLQVDAFIQHPEIKLCYTGFSLIDEMDKEIEALSSQVELKSKVATFESQLLRNRITFSTIMIHKNVVAEGLQFDERPILKASEDYLFLNQILYSHPIYFIEEPLVKYRCHSQSISNTQNSTRRIISYYIRIIICMYEFFHSKKISLFRFFFLLYFHFIHVMKQILFSYYQHMKKYWRASV